MTPFFEDDFPERFTRAWERIEQQGALRGATNYPAQQQEAERLLRQDMRYSTPRRPSGHSLLSLYDEVVYWPGPEQETTQTQEIEVMNLTEDAQLQCTLGITLEDKRIDPLFWVKVVEGIVDRVINTAKSRPYLAFHRETEQLTVQARRLEVDTGSFKNFLERYTADQIKEYVEPTLRRLQERLASSQRRLEELTAPVETETRLLIRKRIVDDLRALLREGATLTTVKGGGLVIVTPVIVLADDDGNEEEFPPFHITFWLSQLGVHVSTDYMPSDAPWFTIEQKNGTNLSYDGNPHPHMSTNYILCLGDSSDGPFPRVREAVSSGDITGLVDLVIGTISTYNEDGPYVPLGEWHGEQWTCACCEREQEDSRDNESFYCNACERSVCDDCHVGNYLCRDCAQGHCDRCENYFTEPQNYCAACDREYCDSCNTCSTCNECGTAICGSDQYQSESTGTLLCLDCYEKETESEADDE